MVIIIALSMIMIEVNKNPDDCGGSALKKDAVILLVLSILVFIGSVGVIVVASTVIFGKSASAASAS
jgi:hypothetical protein